MGKMEKTISNVQLKARFILYANTNAIRFLTPHAVFAANVSQELPSVNTGAHRSRFMIPCIMVWCEVCIMQQPSLAFPFNSTFCRTKQIALGLPGTHEGLSPVDDKSENQCLY